MTRPLEKCRLGLWVHFQAGDMQPLWAGAGEGCRREQTCSIFSGHWGPIARPRRLTLSIADWVVLEPPDAFPHMHVSLDVIRVPGLEEGSHIWAAGDRPTRTRAHGLKNRLESRLFPQCVFGQP